VAFSPLHTAPAASLMVGRPRQPRGELALSHEEPTARCSAWAHSTLLGTSWLSASPTRWPRCSPAVPGPPLIPRRPTSTSWSSLGPPAPFREFTRHAGWIVELFVHTPTSYPRFIERETNEHRSPLLRMCGEGRLLIDTDAFGVTLQDQARHLIEAGPTPLTDREREDRRYALTDQLDDLMGGQDQDELAIIGARLLTSAAELTLLERRRWIGHGKWLLRRAPERRSPPRSRTHRRIPLPCRSSRHAAAGQIARRVLDQSGGPLMEGYHRPAPPE
jgi:hypothetical protein